MLPRDFVSIVVGYLRSNLKISTSPPSSIMPEDELPIFIFVAEIKSFPWSSPLNSIVGRSSLSIMVYVYLVELPKLAFSGSPTRFTINNSSNSSNLSSITLKAIVPVPGEPGGMRIFPFSRM